MSSYEKWNLIITGIGVVVGVGVLLIYFFQLRAMIKAANAALLNAQALIESQRPQIAAHLHRNATQTLTEQTPRVEIALFNRGTTPANDVTYQSWIELLPLPFTDFTSSADHAICTEPMVLYPHHEPIIVNIPIRKGLTDQELTALKKLRVYACIRVRVEYGEQFGPSKRYAEFGFYVRADGFGYLPKYNCAGKSPI
ncbi:MAG: hypothetical protein HYX72_02655 [Acidobacteria bacterium]|nr:hypothetical protein [Acidobacteriota bacterium]